MVNFSSSYGLFSVNLNDGTGTVNAGSPLSLTAALSNRLSILVSASQCASGTGNYTPSVNDNRRVVIQFKPSTASSFEVIPEMDLNPVAYAMDARTLDSYPSNSLLRVESAGAPGIAPSFSPADASELALLATGASAKYAARSTNGTASLLSYTTKSSALSTGDMWFDNSSGQKVLKYYDGTSVQTVGSAGAAATPTGSAAMGPSWAPLLPAGAPAALQVQELPTG